jgi:uncharacterized iron-regulated membrane protein
MTRRVLNWVHLWVGVILCIPFALLGLTGSVLVFQDELAAAIEPEYRRATVGASRPVGEIIDAARAMASDTLRPAFVVMPEAAGESARVRLFPARSGQGSAGTMIAYVDPVTLAPLGLRDPFDGIVRQVFLLHANLMVRADRSGREAIGWLGLGMLTLGLTGIVLWWPRGGRWAAAFTIRRGAKGVRLHRDLHGMVGIWGLVVFVVVSFSGVYLAFPQQTGAVITSVLPGRDLRATAQAIKATPIKDAKPMTVDAAVALALGEVPGATLRSVALAQRPDQPIRVSLARAGDAHGVPPVTVFVDPWSQRILELRDPRSFTAGETVMAWQHALHAGDGLGWVWKILVFLSGLMPTLFGITGVSMWWLKRRARRVATAARAMPAE